MTSQIFFKFLVDAHLLALSWSPFHDVRSPVETDMLHVGVDKAPGDTILGHSLKGTNVYCLNPTDEDLIWAMDKYTEWLDKQLAEVAASVAQDQKTGTNGNEKV